MQKSLIGLIVNTPEPERMKAPDRGESEASKTATWRRGEGDRQAESSAHELKIGAHTGKFK